MEEYYKQSGQIKSFHVKVEEAPLQGNGVDCGVFVCQNAEKIARGALVTTKQEEMAEARKRMLVELITGAINYTQKPNPEKMICLFKSNSTRYHRKAEGCRGDT